MRLRLQWITSIIILLLNAKHINKQAHTRAHNNNSKVNDFKTKIVNTSQMMQIKCINYKNYTHRTA